MEQPIIIHKKTNKPLYDLLSWLIKAIGLPRGAYKLDCLCLEAGTTTKKVRISATDGTRLHTVVMLTPDGFDLSILPINTKNQAVFSVSKTAAFINCVFNDTGRVFPNVHSVLDMVGNIKLCRLDFSGSSADDCNQILSANIRKLYQSIDAKLEARKGPEWKNMGISTKFLQALDREEHDWKVYGSNERTTLKFQHTDGDTTKTALFQALVVRKEKKT